MITLPERFTLSNTQIQTPIYHYCSLDTFMKIVENKCIWLTPIDKMNDYAEGNWLTHLVSRICRERVAAGQGDERLFDIFIQNISSNINSRLAYIACFSEEPDLLSQWRGYADNGKGVVIAFTTHKLAFSLRANFMSALPGSGYYNGLCRVHYVEHNDVDIRNWINQALDSLDVYNYPAIARELSGFALLFKNSAFKEEKEWRIAIAPERNKLKDCWELRDRSLIQKLNFRPTEKGLSSYFATPLSNDSIAKVILGPTNKSEPSDIGAFLLYRFGRKITVERSKATYCG